MNIHDACAEKVQLAQTYAKDGAFLTAARLYAEAAALCLTLDAEIWAKLGSQPPEYERRLDPIIGEFGVDQGSMLALLSRAGLATDPGLKAYADAVETNDELEVDSDPLFSVSDDGCWVSAWVWVTNSEAGIEDDEEDDADEEATA